MNILGSSQTTKKSKQALSNVATILKNLMIHRGQRGVAESRGACVSIARN